MLETTSTRACLSIEGLTKRFGGFYALNDLHVEVASQSIHALIGPNGAGKTTFFNLITGLIEPDGGCVGFIRYKGAEGVEEFTRRLVEESGVLFLPSSIYRSELGPVPENCLRVGFGRSHVPQGFAVLRNWFELEHH